MMSRRRFMQITAAMAAAYAMPLAGPHYDRWASPQALWVPAVPEVAEWLEYYKIAMSNSLRGFHALMNQLGSATEDPRDAMTDREFNDSFAAAERDFLALDDERRQVAVEQYSGYSAGRMGLPRRCERFVKPSHHGFGWYNYWAIGDYDRRREMKLPRLGATLEEEYALLHRDVPAPATLEPPRASA